MSMGSLLHLLFPPTCLICEASGLGLCTSCEEKIVRVTVVRDIEQIKFWAGAYYGDELAQLILLAKEKNNSLARNYLSQLLLESFMRAIANLSDPSNAALIPIPSSHAANRRRGYRHSYLLARALASRIAKESSRDVEVIEALRVNRKIADQSNLNRVERMQNLSGAYSVRSRHIPHLAHSAPESIFLIDDLVTSGSSIREGLRALGQLGISPSGVLAAGVSPRVFS